MACVSYPTCPLAMAEAERVLPDIVDRLDAILMRNGIADRDVIFRVTGCPNGCGRAMLAEIGLGGRAVGRYDVYLGGNREGTRIPRLYKENQPLEEIIRDLDALLSAWAQAANHDVAFGDFAVQTGIIRPVLNSSIDFYLQD